MCAAETKFFVHGNFLCCFFRFLFLFSHVVVVVTAAVRSIILLLVVSPPHTHTYTHTPHPLPHPHSSPLHARIRGAEEIQLDGKSFIARPQHHRAVIFSVNRAYIFVQLFFSISVYCFVVPTK